MPEHGKPLEYYGPKPGPTNTIFLGLVIDRSENIGAEFQSQLDPKLAPYGMHELACYDYMNKSALWHKDLARVPKASPDYEHAREHSEQHKVEAKIMHFALSSIQAEKLERGLMLDAPLTPHNDVEMNLKKPASVPTPEV